MGALTRLGVGAVLFALAAAASAQLPEPVARALQEAGVPEDAVAVYVQRVDQPAPQWSHRADAAMHPASVMKVLTTYAALETLGPAHRWETEAFAEGKVEQGVLHGDLVLKGHGAPDLTREHFRALLQSIRQRGVQTIRGDLVLDRSDFDLPPHDAGAFDGQPHRAYNTGPDALLPGFNAVQFTFVADAAQGVVQVSGDPDFPAVGMENRLALGQGACAGWKSRMHVGVRREASHTRIVLEGEYPAQCGEQSMELDVLDNEAYVLQLFQKYWQEAGGTFSGGVRAGRLSSVAVRLAGVESAPLGEVVRMINKHSNNVMARQLLLGLGVTASGLPGTLDKGRQALLRWLEGKGASLPGVVVDNGSGLSRIERISARHLGHVLLAAWHSPVMPELMASLPVAGRDGTLRARLMDSPVAGRAHLKTGLLEGSRTLAGYVLGAQGARWVVILMVQHPAAGDTTRVQEALLEYVVTLH